MSETRKKYSADDYLYSSARVRALEVKLIGRERCARLCEAKDISEVYRAFEELGRGRSPDDILSDMLAECFSVVSEMTGGEHVFDIWRYPYDCHNIKSIIKCAERGRDPQRLLYSFGTVDTKAAVTAIRDGKTDVFPSHMAGAIQSARDLYAKNHNPQLIDTTLDDACYADMLDTAKNSGIDIFVRLVAAKIDITNILTAIRLSRMQNPAIDARYLTSMLISGGQLPAQTLTYAISGEDELYLRLRTTDYNNLAQRLSNDMTLAAIERECDNYYMELFSAARYMTAGAEVIAAYITAVEYQAKNLRIIVAGKKASLAPAVIRERLRSSYV